MVITISISIQIIAAHLQHPTNRKTRSVECTEHHCSHLRTHMLNSATLFINARGKNSPRQDRPTSVRWKTLAEAVVASRHSPVHRPSSQQEKMKIFHVALMLYICWILMVHSKQITAKFKHIKCEREEKVEPRGGLVVGGRFNY